MFCHTLSHNPSLCSMVRSICHGSEHLEKEEVLFFADAISQCSNLIRFVCRGWHYDHGPMVKALSSSKHLRTVHLSYHGYEMQECHFFCSISSFFSMLQGWPAIERVIVDYCTISTDEEAYGWWDKPNADTHVEEPLKATCPSLCHFDFQSKTLLDVHLSLLSHIAPSIVHLSESLSIINVSDRALGSVLECWIHFLESLSLSGPGDEGKARGPQDDRPDINGMIASLPQLQTLDVPSAYVSTKSLARGFRRLTTLTFMARLADVVPIADILLHSDSLPALRKFTLGRRHRPYSWDPPCAADLLQPLRDACRERGLDADLSM
ncbi:hypothetical protein BV25DRAFT_946229 [Artomyces pyxidatus]|uniref:Uncharacterized protein n=1 Tax=Artomyces pyxidatus TaxID=48021 RepID=A0ACB8SWP5_9AGAM|nr:hypothetical protein BV25DRAFT_946229 [Artomyces pyxidatus]